MSTQPTPRTAVNRIGRRPVGPAIGPGPRISTRFCAEDPHPDKGTPTVGVPWPGPGSFGPTSAPPISGTVDKDAGSLGCEEANMSTTVGRATVLSRPDVPTKAWPAVLRSVLLAAGIGASVFYVVALVLGPVRWEGY